MRSSSKKISTMEELSLAQKTTRLLAFLQGSLQNLVSENYFEQVTYALRFSEMSRGILEERLAEYNLCLNMTPKQINDYFSS